jgi:predicted O-methyltransferase YrrM
MRKISLAVCASLLIVAAAAIMAQRWGSGRVAPASEALPPVARTPGENKVLETINQIVKAGDLYANVPAADGRMLRILAEAVNAKSVVEVGTSTGISGLWFCLAMEKTGGKLTTFELDPNRASLARKHFKLAGVEDRVILVEGDAHRNITNLRDPIDVVFLDAEKEGYVDYLNKLLPLVRPGGLILAHNTNMVPDYMKVVTSSADLDTVVYSSGGGMAVTLKKR